MRMFFVLLVIMLSTRTVTVNAYQHHVFSHLEEWQREKLIDGVPILKLLAKNVYQCNSLCQMTKSCASVSYDVASRSCTILSSSVENTTLGQPQISQVYTNVLGSLVTHPTSACTDQPCPNGIVCLETGESHICVDPNADGLLSYKHICESHVDYTWDTVCGICYKFNTSNNTRQQAVAMCERDGGHLVTIDSLKKQQRIVDVIQADPVLASCNQIWIGADDSQEEGVWRWSDGSLVDFSYWSPGKPDHSSPNEDYVALVKQLSYAWNDRPPSKKRVSICEITI